MIAVIITWAVLIEILLHLFGAGSFFVGVSGTVLAIAFVVGSIGIILNLKTPKEVISTILIGAFMVGFLPALLAGVLQDIWQALSPATVLFIALALLGAALFLSRERR